MSAGMDGCWVGGTVWPAVLLATAEVRCKVGRRGACSVLTPHGAASGVTLRAPTPPLAVPAEVAQVSGHPPSSRRAKYCVVELGAGIVITLPEPTNVPPHVPEYHCVVPRPGPV